MQKFKLLFPCFLLVLSFGACGLFAFFFLREAAFISPVPYILTVLFIPLAYLVIALINGICFFLTGLSLGGEFISPQAALKGYFWVPDSLKASGKFWVLLLLSRLWPSGCILVFCLLTSLTYQDSSICQCLFFNLETFAVYVLLTQTLPLAPRSFPSAVSLIRLLIRDDANKEYLHHIYAINGYRKLNYSYAKIDNSFFLPADASLNPADSASGERLPESPDNPLFSLLWYHTALKIFANQDYERFIPYAEHFLKSHPDLAGKKKNLIRADLLFAELVTYNRTGKIKLLYDKNLKNVLFGLKPRFYALRTRYALDLIFLNDREDADKTLKKWKNRTRFIKGRTFIQEEENLIRLVDFEATY